MAWNVTVVSVTTAPAPLLLSAIILPWVVSTAISPSKQVSLVSSGFSSSVGHLRLFLNLIKMQEKSHIRGVFIGSLLDYWGKDPKKYLSREIIERATC